MDNTSRILRAALSALLLLSGCTGDDGSQGDAGVADFDGGEPQDSGPASELDGALDVDAALVDMDAAVVSRCGDGVVAAGEECDRGAELSDTVSDACRTACFLPRCGDGVVDTGEECDTGPARSDLRADACRLDCTLPRCGDFVLDADETCDTGIEVSDDAPDACRSDCAPARCGDGVVDTGEGCDTGADRSDDEPGACRTDCRQDTCGDGVLDRTERCDLGDMNADLPDTCRTDCSAPRCGDGIRDFREQCDDGNTVAGDGCESCLAPAGVAPVPVVYSPSGVASRACTLVTPTICSALAASTTYTGLETRVGRDLGEEYPCYEYYSIACEGCWYWTEDRCAMPRPPGIPPHCARVGDGMCALLAGRVCPTATLTACRSAAFRSQSPFVIGSVPECTDRVRDSCEGLARSACSADLDTCVPFVRDGGSPTDDCTWWLASRCDGVVSSECRSPSVASCADIPAAVAGRNPYCSEYLTDRCRGWEARFCPSAAPYTVNAENCTERYPTLQSAFPAACHPWLESSCRGRTATLARDTFTAEGGCPSETAIDTSSTSFTIDSSVSSPSRFDCPVYAYEAALPALVEFDGTPAEIVAFRADLTALDASLGTPAIGTCDEFVDQTYYTYGAYRSYTDDFYDDARRVHQLAYSDDPLLRTVAIGQRALTIGQPFGHFPSHAPALDSASFALDGGRGTNYTAKNDYYELYRHPAALAALQSPSTHGFGTPLDDELNGRLLVELGGLQFVYERRLARGAGDGWHFHREMSERLAAQGRSDELLSHHWTSRTRFLALLAEHDRQTRRLELAGSFPHNTLAVLTITRGIQAIDRELQSLLRRAHSAGCFDLRYGSDGEPVPHPCDWAPQDFVEDVAAAFETQKAADLDRCRDLAPADLSTLAGGYTYLRPGSTTFIHEPADPRATSAAFETYLDRQEYTVANLESAFDTDDPARRPLWGQSFVETDTIGIPEWFGAGYSIGAGWLVDLPPSGPGLCGIDAHADASLAAWVDLATVRFDAIDAGVNAELRAERFDTHLEVLGVDIWDESLASEDGPVLSGYTYDFNVVFQTTVAADEISPSVSAPVFSLAGFDVVVRVGASGRLGFDVSGALSLAIDDSDGCGPGAAVSLVAAARPFASLGGFAEVGIDLFIVEIGVGASLQVVDLSLPVSTSISLVTPGPLAELGSADLRIAVDADLELELLSGRVYAYADTWWETYKTTLFRWRGPRWSTNLFHKDYSYPLGPLVTYCDLHPSVCR